MWYKYTLCTTYDNENYFYDGYFVHFRFGSIYITKANIILGLHLTWAKYISERVWQGGACVVSITAHSQHDDFSLQGAAHCTSHAFIFYSDMVGRFGITLPIWLIILLKKKNRLWGDMFNVLFKLQHKVTA